MMKLKTAPRGTPSCWVISGAGLWVGPSMKFPSEFAGALAPPTRDPNTSGYVTAKALPDGANAPPNSDGNFILGPTHNPAPEMTQQEGVPRGAVFNFIIESSDSKIYPGIAREADTFGKPDPADPAKLLI